MLPCAKSPCLVYHESTGDEHLAGLSQHRSHERYRCAGFAEHSLRYLTEGHSCLSPGEPLMYGTVVWTEVLAVWRGISPTGRAAEWIVYLCSDSGPICQ